MKTIRFVFYYESHLIKIMFCILSQLQFTKDDIANVSNAMQNGEQEVVDRNVVGGKSSQEFELFCAYKQRIDAKISKVLMATNRTTSVSFIVCIKHHDEYLQCQMQPLQPRFSNNFITTRLLLRFQCSQNPTSSANNNIKLNKWIYSLSMKIPQRVAVRRK